VDCTITENAGAAEEQTQARRKNEATRSNNDLKVSYNGATVVMINVVHTLVQLRCDLQDSST
jgi:hypothetical protein